MARIWWNSRILAGAAVAACALLLAVRAYVSRPTVLPGSGPIETIEIRRRSITAKLLPQAKMSQAADTGIFDGFTPEDFGYEVERRIGEPDRWEEESESCYYSEWIRPAGRLRLYSELEYDQEGSVEGQATWIVCYPNDAISDEFFCREISRHLDVTEKEFVVRVICPSTRTRLIAHVERNRVTRVALISR